jgi:hypothetical protein
MIAATIHRRWAREYLARAQHATTRDRKRRYLQLAVTNTVCARKLEKCAEESNGDHANNGPAEGRPAPITTAMLN